jgi:hypothetical protein
MQIVVVPSVVAPFFFLSSRILFVFTPGPNFVKLFTAVIYEIFVKKLDPKDASLR